MQRQQVFKELEARYDIKLGRCLGHGGFGEVYEAKVGGVACALKVPFEPLTTEGAVKEAEALKLVPQFDGHPHIVGLRLVRKIHGYLVTGWDLGQQSLAERLKEYQRQGAQGIPPKELLGYMREAAVALDDLNRKGIYHRDIKPENLILFHGHVKVGDLGLAKFVGASTGSHSGCGTPDYMAPETHQDRTTATTDLYALAVTYIVLRTGHRAFGASPDVIVTRQRASDPDVRGLTAAEARVVREALAYGPEDRPQDGALAWVYRMEQAVAVSHHTRPPPSPRPPNGESGRVEQVLDILYWPGIGMTVMGVMLCLAASASLIGLLISLRWPLGRALRWNDFYFLFGLTTSLIVLIAGGFALAAARLTFRLQAYDFVFMMCIALLIMGLLSTPFIVGILIWLPAVSWLRILKRPDIRSVFKQGAAAQMYLWLFGALLVSVLVLFFTLVLQGA